MTPWPGFGIYRHLPNGDKGDQWMEECESSSMIAYAIDLNKNIKFTGSTGCRPRHGLIGGKKKKS